MYPRYFKCPVCKERAVPFRDKWKIKPKRPARCRACGSELQVHALFDALFTIITYLPGVSFILLALLFFPIATGLHWVSGLLLVIIGMMFLDYLATLILPLKQVEPRNDKNSDDVKVKNENG